MWISTNHAESDGYWLSQKKPEWPKAIHTRTRRVSLISHARRKETFSLRNRKVHTYGMGHCILVIGSHRNNPARTFLGEGGWNETQTFLQNGGTAKTLIP